MKLFSISKKNIFVLIIIFSCLISLFFFSNYAITNYSQAQYYDAHGNKISKKQYYEVVRKWRQEVKEKIEQRKNYSDNYFDEVSEKEQSSENNEHGKEATVSDEAFENNKKESTKKKNLSALITAIENVKPIVDANNSNESGEKLSEKSAQVKLAGLISKMKGITWNKNKEGIYDSYLSKNNVDINLEILLPEKQKINFNVFSTYQFSQKEGIVTEIKLNPMKDKVSFKQDLKKIKEIIKKFNATLNDKEQKKLDKWDNLKDNQLSNLANDYYASIEFNPNKSYEVKISPKSDDKGKTWYYIIEIEAERKALRQAYVKISASKFKQPMIRFVESSTMKRLVVPCPSNASIFASATSKGKIKIYDISSKKLKRKLQVENISPNDSAYAMKFSKNGKILVCGFEGGTIATLDVNTGKTLKIMKTTEKSYPKAISNDLKKVAVSKEKIVELWDIKSGKKEFELKQSKNARRIEDIQFSPDGKILAISYEHSGIARLYKVNDGSLIKELVPKKSFSAPKIFKMVFAPSGKTLIAGGHMARKISFWDIATGKITEEITSDAKSKIAISPNGKLIAGSTWSTMTFESIRIFDIKTKKQIARLAGIDKVLTSICFSGDDKYLIGGQRGKEILIWKL